jgi:protein-tyrosine phosphatase
VLDLHSHVLPGIDDGVATTEDACELARSAAVEGVTAIAATPHVRDDYPTTHEQMEAGVAELRVELANRGIAIDVLHGGEVALERLASLSDDAVRRLTIAQTGRYLLLECPYFGWPLSLRTILFELQLKGITPILAHPERNPDVQARPERLRELVDAGLLVQVTAASVDGRLGSASQRAARSLFELGFAHVLASDAHHPSLREVGFAGAITALGDETLSQYLTEAAPAAIAAGENVPPPPQLKKGRHWFRIGKG